MNELSMMTTLPTPDARLASQHQAEAVARSMDCGMQAIGGFDPAKNLESRVELGQEEARMTKEKLKEICLKRQGWELPSLNDQLILNYSGFRKIENLEEYENVRALFLDCNGIARIENLEPLQKVVQLYLHQNCIERIENLDCLPNLIYLNLANNRIQKVESLGGLKVLETLNLASNKIHSVPDLDGLRACPSLLSVDVSCNYIEVAEQDNFVEFWGEATPQLQCLYLHHNPCQRLISNYRRRLVSTLPKLRFLDQRKVDDQERQGSEAWALGIKEGGAQRGKETELEAKRRHWEEEQEKKRRDFENMKRIQEAGIRRIQRENAEREEKTRQAAAEARFRETGDLDPGYALAPAQNGGGGGRRSPSGAAAGDTAAAVRQTDSVKERMRKFLDGAPKPAVAPAAAPSSLEVEEETEEGDNDDDDKPASSSSFAPAPRGSALAAANSASKSPTGAECSSSDQKGEQEEEQGKAAQEQPARWEWTAIREARLAKLASTHRYNFQLTAKALVQEFGCSEENGPSEEDCRTRFGEIRRLQKQQKQNPGAKGGGAAAVVTGGYSGGGVAPSSPTGESARSKAEVQDSMKWWLRQLEEVREKGGAAGGAEPPASVGGTSQSKPADASSAASGSRLYPAWDPSSAVAKAAEERNELEELD